MNVFFNKVWAVMFYLIVGRLKIEEQLDCFLTNKSFNGINKFTE